MAYIYSGEDIYRLENALKRLYEKNHIDKEHRVFIDASDKKTFHIQQVLNECDSFSLFDEDKKAIIVRDPFFLSSSSKEAEKVNKTDSPAVKKRKEKEASNRDNRLTLLEEYLKHENTNSLLIFLCHGYNADSRKKDYKLLTQYNAETLNFPKMDEKDYASFVGKRLKEEGLALNNASILELIQRTGGDTLLLSQAIEKIKLYGEINPTLEDIKHLVSSSSDLDIFKLTSAFTQGDVQNCFEAINEMLIASYDYNTMITMLAKRLRTIYNFKLLHEKGYSNDEIATRMHVKSGYVWFVLKDSTSLTTKKILDYLKQLADMDQSIKQGESNAKDVFEDFILRNSQRKQVGYYHG